MTKEHLNTEAMAKEHSNTEEKNIFPCKGQKLITVNSTFAVDSN